MDTVLVPVLGTLGGCVSCVVMVEMISKNAPTAMNLMTFSTFSFISLYGFVFESKFLTKRNKIPLSKYVRLVLLFFGVSVVNNWALSYSIPMPLHIIFKSGSLLASLLLGMLLLNRRYPSHQILSVIMVTLGIIICTMVTASGDKKGSRKQSALTDQIIGVGMLASALITSAYMGIVQEKLYSRYGKHPNEAMFYVHALSLPLFAVFWKEIFENSVKFTNSSPLNVPIVGELPSLWCYLFLVDIFQFVCIKCVYMLTAELSALNVTLIITLRKFISLIISIVYFGNPFTFYHWLGATLVFGGTLLFNDVFRKVYRLVGGDAKTKKN